jgi:hypothetical protein
MTLSMNTKNLEAGLARLRKKVGPEALEKGVAQAGIQFMYDVVNEYPSVPKHEGTLEGSTSLHVATPGKRPKFFAAAKAAMGDPARGSLEETAGRSSYLAVVGVSGPQAARLHEHPEYNFQQQKGTEGGWFILRKLMVFRKNYLQIIAGVMKEYLK